MDAGGGVEIQDIFGAAGLSGLFFLDEKARARSEIRFYGISLRDIYLRLSILSSMAIIRL